LFFPLTSPLPRKEQVEQNEVNVNPQMATEELRQIVENFFSSKNPN